LTKLKVLPLIVVIIIVNAFGFFIKYHGYNALLILLGYRLYIGLVIPFLFFVYKIQPSFLKRSLKKNPLDKIGFIFLVILISIILTSIIYIFLSKKINFSPEYFYEFGISSIFDYPVYLIWNAPQLLLFGLFITLLHESKFSYFYMTLILPLFFMFELFFIKDVRLIGITIFSSLVVSFLMIEIYRLNKNLYSISIFVFSVIWSSILVFGSSSQLLINNFFAAQYNSWQGFLIAQDNLKISVIPFNLFLTAIIFMLFRNKIRHKQSKAFIGS
jgi:hypothetical protein